ncbi:hypothetical protein AAC387_Pa10g2030 [Persea americana]
MEKRENTGEIRKPEEHVVDNWGNKGKEGDGHKQGNDLHLPLSDSYSFIPLFHHGLEESHSCKEGCIEDLKTVEAERFGTGSHMPARIHPSLVKIQYTYIETEAKTG